VIVGFILAAVFSLALASFFSAGEAALSAFSRERLAALSRRSEQSQAELSDLTDREELLLSAVAARLLFSMLFFVVCGWAGVWLFPAPPRAYVAVAVALLGAFIVVLLFAEVAAKSFARANAEHTLIQITPALRAASALLWPARWLFRVCNRAFGRLFGAPIAETPDAQAAEEARLIAQNGEQNGLLQKEQKEMIESVVSLPDVDVEEVMTPRTDMIALPHDANVRQAYKLFLDRGVSRIPVYQETLDEIVGVLYAKDLLPVCSAGRAETTGVTELMRKPFFVPETKRVGELLHEMRAHKMHMAIVLDEYGGTAGLVTNEDIVEEIVGEIEDEFDTEDVALIKRVGPHALEVDAQTHIDDVNEALGVSLPESEDYETVGGFLLYSLSRVPGAGETFEHDNVHFTVLEATPRRITRLRLEGRPEPLPAAGK